MLEDQDEVRGEVQGWRKEAAKMMRGVLRQQHLRRRGVEIGNLPSRAGSHAQY